MLNFFYGYAHMRCSAFIVGARYFYVALKRAEEKRFIGFCFAIKLSFTYQYMADTSLPALHFSIMLWLSFFISKYCMPFTGDCIANDLSLYTRGHSGLWGGIFTKGILYRL